MQKYSHFVCTALPFYLRNEPNLGSFAALFPKRDLLRRVAGADRAFYCAPSRCVLATAYQTRTCVINDPYTVRVIGEIVVVMMRQYVSGERSGPLPPECSRACAPRVTTTILCAGANAS